MTESTSETTDVQEDMFSADQVRALIRQEMSAAKSDHDAEVESLKATISAMQASLVGTVPVTVPEHAGGVGTDIAQTWSLYDQENARAEKLAATRKKAAAL